VFVPQESNPGPWHDLRFAHLSELSLTFEFQFNLWT